ncbi:ferric reduction oxidase 5-like [Impatiens glandulifera]|uniref:ferric reduction oxidase 5-like n=1 Tax=Impatiens glandulifera TaxID=253017 RepID=UPI001FB12F3E|nr:ferric reduction oxidase 5-like [Impatiens glandulifera]
MGSLTLILRMMFFIVLVGWLVIWIIIPTSTYKNSWTPNLIEKIGSSTYFGSQGTNLLLLSFPVMLLAALGCVYLHLETIKKEKIACGSSSMHRPDFLRRPVHISSTFGSVTMTELVFVAMFFALLIWSLANYLYISFGHLHMHKEGEKVWQAKFRSVSLRLGYIGNICWAFLFFPVTRGSSILPMVGLTSESSIKYHIWLGHISNLLFTLHTIGFIIYWGLTQQMSLMLEWSKTYVSNVAGWIAMLFGWAIWVTSFPSIRRKAFELFFYTHHLYALYIVFYLIHVGGPYVFMILPGIFLFIIDRYLRFLQSQKRARLVSARLLPCEVVELNFSKCHDLRYNPTSIMFVHVPSISKLQWHPFTVISSGNLELDIISVAIKSQGSWSQKLYKELSSSKSHLEVHVEGPYGPVSPDLLRRDCLVMVSGGSGITPFISVIREVIHLRTQTGSHIPKMHLICVFKNSIDLTMLDLLLPASSMISPEILSKLELKIEAYVTKDIEEQPKSNRDLIHSIWFKPNPNDSLVTAALGSSSWLWLGAIITTSFLMFLLLLGIVTRHLIYPIEHNKQIYNFSGKVLWDMFLACVGVFIGTSAIFLWQKKKISGTEGKQVQNVELQTPTASPGLQFHGGETTELESLPRDSLVQDIAVHHGARPNLKKILFDCEGSDVGVMVCGPKEMRHEVARICSSGLAENLHFEAISFNW